MYKTRTSARQLLTNIGVCGHFRALTHVSSGKRTRGAYQYNSGTFLIREDSPNSKGSTTRRESTGEEKPGRHHEKTSRRVRLRRYICDSGPGSEFLSSTRKKKGEDQSPGASAKMRETTKQTARSDYKRQT